METFFKVMPMI